MGAQRLKLGIIGCGKMAEAMLARWLETGALTPAEVVACTGTAASAARVTTSFGIDCGTSAQAVCDRAATVLLAVKPQLRHAVIGPLRPRPDQLWLSVLAGVPTTALAAALPDVRLIRLMPNTPVRLGQGLVALVAGQRATPQDVAATHALLAPLGTVLELPEAQLDAFTAIAGSGPAYVFLFLEALANAAVRAGLEPELAARLAEQTLVGAALLAAASPQSPAVLRAEVTSKGGMTEAALATLATAGWSPALGEAVAAAVARARGLAGETLGD